MNIITLTLNPAFDIHCYVKDFVLYREHLACVTSRDASGKGINISRTLWEGGIDNLAFAVIGDENGEDFVKCLNDDNVKYISVTEHGRIRENITVHTNDAPETRISFSGFTASADLLKRSSELLLPLIDSDTVITCTGRVTDGLTMPDVKNFLCELEQKGARIVIDSRSFGLDDIIQMKPWLIKPNQEEISAYLGREIDTFDKVLEAAKELHAKGIANVMISLGEKGALLVCDEGTYRATPPSVKAVSTIGAGDSTIAGFLAAVSCGYNIEKSLMTAVSYGTAACLAEGTRPPKKADIENILPKVKIDKI